MVAMIHLSLKQLMRRGVTGLDAGH